MKLKLSLISLILIFISNVYGSTPFQYDHKGTKYITYFGQCPSKVAGTLTLILVKEFEQSKSLKMVKEKIINEDLENKHFLSDYQVSFNPQKKQLKFKYDCPKPLMKVQVYKENQEQSYSAILVKNGKLFDPTYEVLLRSDKKLNHELPSLAIPLEELDNHLQSKIADIFRIMGDDFSKLLSEIIIEPSKELTIILSLNGRPSSAFLGKSLWDLKVQKLMQIINYMEKNNKVPTVINLINAKKIVVKFSS